METAVDCYVLACGAYAELMAWHPDAHDWSSPRFSSFSHLPCSLSVAAVIVVLHQELGFRP